MELAIVVKHLRHFVDDLILPILLELFIILKDKVVWNKPMEPPRNISYIKQKWGSCILLHHNLLFLQNFIFNFLTMNAKELSAIECLWQPTTQHTYA